MEFHAAYNYYCDESCHLKNDGKQYMILGYISAPYDRIKKLKEDIKELRKKYKNTHRRPANAGRLCVKLAGLELLHKKG